MTRDFSSRYCEMRPPTGAPARSNWSSMYLPKRELLSLRSVFALPNASRTGFDSRRRSCMPAPSETAREMCAMYRMKIFDASVLPAPDSPVMMTHWFVFSIIIER
eukprot:Amastigsp_a844096_6.p4 type:complete len:105 gc:universal Amastigsp_a844096_6:472-786(+)